MKRATSMFCAAVFLICTATPLLAQDSSPDANDFRRVLYELLVGMENAAGLESDASLAVLQASPEEIDAMFSHIQDRERFFTSAQRVMDHMALGSALAVADEPMATQEEPISAADLGRTPYPPEYPPGSGLYYSKIIPELRFYGLLSSHDERCNSPALADYYSIWWEAYTAAEIVDVACVVAGCDPSGIFCAIVCAGVEVLKKAVFVAGRPLNLCGFHDAYIDSAELQAGYENSVGIIHNLNEHDGKITGQLNAQFTAVTSQISTHDTEIKNQIEAHDTDVMNELAAVHTKLDQQQLLLLMMRPLMIENNLAVGVCPAWMYKPEYLDDDFTDPYRGYLEEVFAVVQKTIDDARLMGCPEERQLERSQFVLDKTRELLANGLPLEGGKLCAGLAKAYHLATLRMGESCRTKSKPKKR